MRPTPAARCSAGPTSRSTLRHAFVKTGLKPRALNLAVRRHARGDQEKHHAYASLRKFRCCTPHLVSALSRPSRGARRGEAAAAGAARRGRRRRARRARPRARRGGGEARVGDGGGQARRPDRRCRHSRRSRRRGDGGGRRWRPPRWHRRRRRRRRRAVVDGEADAVEAEAVAVAVVFARLVLLRRLAANLDRALSRARAAPPPPPLSAPVAPVASAMLASSAATHSRHASRTAAGSPDACCSASCGKATSVRRSARGRPRSPRAARGARRVGDEDGGDARAGERHRALERRAARVGVVHEARRADHRPPPLPRLRLPTLLVHPAERAAGEAQRRERRLRVEGRLHVEEAGERTRRRRRRRDVARRLGRRLRR